MNKLALMLAATVALAATPALAHDSTCYSNPHYFVIAHAYTESAGTEFIIRKKEASAEEFECSFERTPGNFRIGENEDPLWFEDLQGDHLVLSRSTGPQGDLLVYNLWAEEKVLEVPADIYTIDEKGVTFWERTDIGTADNCAGFAENEANDLGSAIITETRFTFADETLTKTGNTDCQSTQ